MSRRSGCIHSYEVNLQGGEFAPSPCAVNSESGKESYAKQRQYEPLQVFAGILQHLHSRHSSALLVLYPLILVPLSQATVNDHHTYVVDFETVNGSCNSIPQG